MTVISASLLLFLVMDPIGNIPFFLTTLKNVEPKRQRFIIIREHLIALSILVLFLFFGQYILQILQISEPALTVAGGIILFLIALRMVFPGFKNGDETISEGEPFIVPLAIPLIAGPSAMASVMLIMSHDTGRWQEWLLSLTIAWLASGTILYLASSLRRILGKRGLVAIERLMGMVLITIATQMVLSGIRKFMEI